MRMIVRQSQLDHAIANLQSDIDILTHARDRLIAERDRRPKKVMAKAKTNRIRNKANDPDFLTGENS